MLLEKDGIRIEALNGEDMARMKRLGYQEVSEAVSPPAVLEAKAVRSSEESNAEAIKEVNTSKRGSRSKAKGSTK